MLISKKKYPFHKICIGIKQVLNCLLISLVGKDGGNGGPRSQYKLSFPPLSKPVGSLAACIKPDPGFLYYYYSTDPNSM